MPLSKLFADRVHYFEDLPFMEAYQAFEAPVSSYVSPDLLVEERTISASGLKIPVLIYKSASAQENAPVIIWMHGGGFQHGTYKMNEGDVVARELAHRGKATVVNVEYRLVSESVKFPAPQDDCMAVLEWVAKNCEGLGGNPNSIFVGGVSAGGCLAASLAVLDRDNGNNYIAGQLLNCPILHLELPPQSEELKRKMDEIPRGLGFTPEIVLAINQFALESGDIRDFNPSWMPGELSDLSGLPPAQIINCEYDTLRASGEKYAAQLIEAGSLVEIKTQAGVPHAHLNRVPKDCPEIIETLENMIRFINEVSA
jgi:acetyl esterase/lipase